MNKIIASTILAAVAVPFIIYKIKKNSNGKQCNFKPNLKKKVCIITGANAGIGKQTALQLARLNATIIFACRNEQSTNKTIQEIQKKTQNLDLVFMKLDLSDFDQIREFCQLFRQKYSRLDILINNAGVYALPEKQFTKQGIEFQLGVNYFGHFLLTVLLLDVMKHTHQSRIINVTANLYKLGELDLVEMENNLQSRKQYHLIKNYGDSKLCQIYFTQQLQKILDNQNVFNNLNFNISKFNEFEQQQIESKVCCLHPGVGETERGWQYIKQNFLYKFILQLFSPLIWLFAKNLESLAQTTLYCSLIDFDQLQSGQFYKECGLSKIHPKFTNKNEFIQKLWNLSEKIAGVNTQQILLN